MSQPIAVPVEAATVILLRQAQEGRRPIECFMVRRHIKSEFMGDVFVFPGGKVDAEDRDPALAAFISEGKSLAPADLDSSTWRGLQVAALRELFEEAGVLLARHHGVSVELHGSMAEPFSHHRRMVQAGEMSLAELCRVEHLTLSLDCLHVFSHWITPDIMPRRFDTWFFLAELPLGQEPLHDALETTDSRWIAPQTALEAYEQGMFPLVFATEMHLRRLARFDSIKAMVESVTPRDLEPIMPAPVEELGVQKFFIPADRGY